MRSQGCGHLLTVLGVGARHGHENLHGHMRGDLSFAHVLLNRLREDLHQRQPPRDPAHIAIEPPAQLVQAPAEPLLELGQQPPLFECGLLFRQAHRALEQKRFGLAHRPDHRLDRVPAQLLQRRDPLVAVDHQVSVRLLGSHHHDRSLLARFGQRGQEPPLTLGAPYPKMPEAPLELVKLHFHGPLMVGQAATGITRRDGEVAEQPLWNQSDTLVTGIARRAGGVVPEPL